MALLMAIVATICAVMVAMVFVLAWHDKDIPLTVLLGVVLFSLLVLAMLALRVSLWSASSGPRALEEPPFTYSLVRFTNTSEVTEGH